MRPLTVAVSLGLAGSVALAWVYFRHRATGASSAVVDAATQGAASVTDVSSEALGEVQVTLQKIGLKDAPRGIRNNNPGNLDYLPPSRAWNGQVGSDGRYGVYGSPAAGVRALAKQLQKDYRLGARTVRDLIAEWAPPSENNTTAYVNAVSRATGLAADEPLDLVPNLPAFAAAIIQHENGQQPYDPSDLQQWVYLA